MVPSQFLGSMRANHQIVHVVDDASMMSECLGGHLIISLFGADSDHPTTSSQWHFCDKSLANALSPISTSTHIGDRFKFGRTTTGVVELEGPCRAGSDSHFN